MPTYAYNKVSRGQIKSLPNYASESDADDWINVLPLWPETPQHYNRQGATVAKVSRDLADSTALPTGYSISITHLWVWVSLGYMMDETANVNAFRLNGAGGETGTCIDALDKFDPLCRVVRDTGGGWVAERGYEEQYPNAGLAVHAMVRPDTVLAFATSGGLAPLRSEFGVPVTTQLFWQAFEQPVPMTYHRNNWRNLIPDGQPLVINATEKAQIEMKNSAGTTQSSMFEFDVVVQGTLTTP